MAAVEIVGVSKRFGEAVALDGVSATVEEGRGLCLFGPSGCGKTTLLRLVAGLERADAGEVRLWGHTVSSPTRHVPPAARGACMVFQDFVLWPHMRVERHLDFVLRAAGMVRKERRRRIDALLDLVEMTDKRRAVPRELSGGQQQRLAIARALAPRPRLLLLDEPFSNLDDDLRTRVRAEIRRVKQEEGTTLLVATHDRTDAETLADATLTLPGALREPLYC